MNTILFLTNNQNALALADWLRDQGENAIISGDRIDKGFIDKRGIEFIVSFNYRSIIIDEVIRALPRRVINLHIGYLPFNRGASPNLWSFIEQTPSGVTIHEVDRGIDTGDILLQEKIAFDYKKETLASAYAKSLDLIQSLFKSRWSELKNLSINAVKQTGGGGGGRITARQRVSRSNPRSITT
ncbi:MAG: hypothetical protein LBF86_09365, partial [Helicobacteraceae bacterium]|nr:hypothetical protein [Helicobacteraceae bacterium]